MSVKAQEPPPRALTAKGRRSRARLLDAARQVFGRDGFQGARITDIADAAGAAHGSFYTYFDSKEAVFKALLEELEGGLIGPRSSRSDRDGVEADGPSSRPPATGERPDPVELIQRRNLEYLEYYVENREVLIVWEQVATLNDEVAAMRHEATLRVVRRVQRSIERLQADGQVDARIDPVYAAYALAGMVSRFAYGWMLNDEPFEIERAAEQLSLLWANSLGLNTDDQG